MKIITFEQYENIRRGLTTFLGGLGEEAAEKFIYKEINGFSYEDREEHKKILVVGMDFVHDAWISKLHKKLIMLTILSHYCGNMVEHTLTPKLLKKINQSDVSKIVKSMKHSIEVMKYTNGGEVKRIH